MLSHNLQLSQQCLQTLKATTMTQKFGDEASTSINLFCKIAFSFGPTNMQEIFNLNVVYLI
jgi:hypothetical protein